MRKWLKWSLGIAGGLILLLVIAVLAVPALVDVEQYKPRIEQQASRTLGRPVRFTGPIDLSLFPWAGLSISGLQVENPAGFSEPDFLTAESFQLRIRLLPLLSRAIEVEQFVLKSPRIVLEKNSQGKGNWEDLGPDRTGDSAAPPAEEAPETPPSDSSPPDGDGLPVTDLAVDELTITGGNLLWIDHASETRQELSAINLRLENIAFDTPVTIAFSARTAGQPVSLRGSIGPVGREPGKAPLPFDLTAGAAEQFSARFSGEVKELTDSPSVTVSLRVDPFSPRRLMTDLGQPFPVLTADPDALTRVALQAEVTASPRSATLSEGVLTLDDTTLHLSLRAEDFTKPDLTFQMEADAIDLNRYLPPETAGDAPPEPSGKEETGAPVDPALLRQMALNGSIKIGSLKAAGMETRDLNLDITGKEGTVTLSLDARPEGHPVSLQAALGPVQTARIPVDIAVRALEQVDFHLKGQVDQPTASPSVTADIRLAPFSPRKLLTDLGLPFPVATTDPDALNRIGFRGGITASPDAVAVTDGVLTLDETTARLSGRAAQWATGPDIRFALRLDSMNLDRYLPPPSPSDAPVPETQTEEAKPVDYGPLRRLRIDGSAHAGTFRAADMTFQNIDLKISGEKGMFRLDPLTVDLYGGRTTARATLDVRRAEPESRLDLQVSGVEISPLLQDLLQKDVLEGTTRADLSLQMNGDTPGQILRTISGQGELLFTDGAVKGINLTSMIQNVKTAFGLLGEKPPGEIPRTDFAELKTVFNIVSGVVRVSDAKLVSPFLRVNAAGQANLAQETLDFRISPTFVSTAKGKGDVKARSGYMVPVMVGGTFSSPAFRPDLKAIIRITPEEVVSEIIKDPKEGVDRLLKKQKEALKDILNPGAGQERKEKPEAQPPPSQKERSPSLEEQIGDIMQNFPFGRKKGQ